MLMAIMIAENINNRKPEGRFSTFNLDLIEKGAHAGRPRLQRGAQTAASRTTLERRWRDILQSKILFFFFWKRFAEWRRFESLCVWRQIKDSHAPTHSSITCSMRPALVFMSLLNVSCFVSRSPGKKEAYMSNRSPGYCR